MTGLRICISIGIVPWMALKRASVIAQYEASWFSSDFRRQETSNIYNLFFFGGMDWGRLRDATWRITNTSHYLIVLRMPFRDYTLYVPPQVPNRACENANFVESIQKNKETYTLGGNGKFIEKIWYKLWPDSRNMALAFVAFSALNGSLKAHSSRNQDLRRRSQGYWFLWTSWSRFSSWPIQLSAISCFLQFLQFHEHEWTFFEESQRSPKCVQYLGA